MKRLETTLTHKLNERRPLKYCKLCKAKLRSINTVMLEKKQKLNMAEPKAEQNARRHTKLMKKPLINKRLRRGSHRPVITEKRQQDVKDKRHVIR